MFLSFEGVCCERAIQYLRQLRSSLYFLGCRLLQDDVSLLLKEPLDIDCVFTLVEGKIIRLWRWPCSSLGRLRPQVLNNF